MGCLSTKPECPDWKSPDMCRCQPTEIVCFTDARYHKKLRPNIFVGWDDASDVAYCPQSGLFVLRQGVFKGEFDRTPLGKHSIDAIRRVDVFCDPRCGGAVVACSFRGWRLTEYSVQFTGSHWVRALQRWWRRVCWARRALPVAMALHARLGRGSGLQVLGDDLVLLCLTHYSFTAR
jgi:hypothetical protein